MLRIGAGRSIVTKPGVAGSSRARQQNPGTRVTDRVLIFRPTAWSGDAMTKAEQGLPTSVFGHIMMLRRTIRRIFSQDDAMIQARDFGGAFAARVCSLVLIFPARAQTHSGMILIRHDFAESAQGWLISGDANMKEPIH